MCIYYDYVYDIYLDHCGISSWLRNSQIMYAESEPGKYNSKYTRISRLMIPFAHSPGIIYAPDTDEWVLMYVHNKSTNYMSPCTECTNGTTVNHYHNWRVVRL